MWTKTKYWIHHLVNPHCQECAAERLDENICASCEILKQQLEIANIEKGKLLDSILRKDEPSAQVEQMPVIRPRHLPWAVQRQQLEKAEALKAAQLRMKVDKELTQDKVERRAEITDTRLEDLEKELGVDNAS